MALVMEVCEYIYVMDFGALIFEGTPDEVAIERDRAGGVPRHETTRSRSPPSSPPCATRATT